MQENQREEELVCTYAMANVELKPGSMRPQPRGGATLTQVENRDVYVIGGANREGICFGDVNKFDLGTILNPIAMLAC